MSVEQVWMCSWRDCMAEADAELCAQWTIFDFDSWPTCFEHISDVWGVIGKRLVDGAEPEVIWVNYITR